MAYTPSDRYSEIPADLPMLLTTDEASKLLGVSRKHVCYLLDNGKLKGVKLSDKVWRVNRDYLLDYAGLR